MRCFTVDVSVSTFQRMSLPALMRQFRGAPIPTGHLTPRNYALTCTDVAAAAPVIGRYLEPLGTLVAAGAWVRRNAPGSAAWLNGAAQQISGRTRIPPKAGELQALTDVALTGLVAPDLPVASWPAPDRRAPFLRARGLRSRYLYRSSVRYGDAPQQVLDVWRRRDLDGPAPVLVFVPGGGWLHGGRQLQGYSLMSHMAEQGWVCVSVQYRVAPRHRWPRHIRDVRAAVAWTRAHIHDFGGDPRFVAVAGCSAGGHLAALTGLTPHDADFDAELAPGADPSVDAVVGLYGRYDWMDRSTRERDEFVRFIEKFVVRRSIDGHHDVFENASPIARVQPDAPPFLVIHGDSDHVIPVGEAHAFVQRLRSVSRSAVTYLEIPGAGHGFDLTDPHSTNAAIHATSDFLEAVRRNHHLTTHRLRPCARPQ
jgi:acetyl esterase/lipase